MDEVSIFTIFKAVTDKLGITQAWLTATSTNVMMLTAIVKAKFALFDGFWPTTALVTVSAAALAAVEFIAMPINILVAAVLIWGSTTLLMKGTEKGIDIAKSGFNRGPSLNESTKP